MDQEFTQEWQEQIRKFCEKQMEPHLEKDEQESLFRQEIFHSLGELGLCGITTPEKYGGLEQKLGVLCFVLEELSRFSISYSVTLSVSSMVQFILNQFGNEEQKKTYLPNLASGEKIGAFALTESHAGSDAAALKTTAKKTDKAYILNGQKLFITSGGIAETYIVMARTGDPESRNKGISAFIVPNKTPGLKFGKLESKMGWKISPTREVILENCEVPAENLLGNEGDGLKIALTALNRGRITIASMALGLASRALDESLNFSFERKQFGQEIFQFQGLQFMLAHMQTELFAAKGLVQMAIKAQEEGSPSIELAAMAKIKATDMAMSLTTDAVQIFGGVGYTTEYPLERFMRDAKALQIVEGTNQIQKVILAREMQKRALS